MIMSEHIEYEMAGKPIESITLDNICGNGENRPLSYWAPRREEIQRFVEIAKAVLQRKGKPKVLDAGCGTGFLAYLMAETGEVDVVGLDPDESLVNGSLYSHPNLKLEVGDSTDAVRRYANQDIDMVISSWMPGELNLTPDIRNIGARTIVYVKEAGGATGVPPDGWLIIFFKILTMQALEDYLNKDVFKPKPKVSREDRISYEPGQNYVRAYGWSGPAATEIKNIARRLRGEKEVTFSLRERIFGFGKKDRNLIDIQVRKDIPIPGIPSITINESQKYGWEKDLEKVKGPLKEMYSIA